MMKDVCAELTSTFFLYHMEVPNQHGRQKSHFYLRGWWCWELSAAVIGRDFQLNYLELSTRSQSGVR